MFRAFQPHVRALKLHPVVHSIGHQPAGVPRQQGVAVFVVPVHHAHVAPAEQLPLPGPVFLKAGMLARAADVIRVKVGEHAHIVMDAGHPVHHQPLARHLHHHAVASGRQHLAEHLLQLIALRGGVDQGVAHLAVGHAVCSNDPAAAPRGQHHRADHVGGGGFALGPGHPDHGHALCRVAEKVAAHQRQSPPARGHLDHRHPLGRLLQLVLDHQHPGAAGHHVGGVVVAVAGGPHNAHKGYPDLYLAGIVHDVPHLGGKIPLHQGVLHTLQKLFQFHSIAPLFALFIALQSTRRTR